jgi:hypothetical protein
VPEEQEATLGGVEDASFPGALDNQVAVAGGRLTASRGGEEGTREELAAVGARMQRLVSELSVGEGPVSAPALDHGTAAVQLQRLAEQLQAITAALGVAIPR